VFHIIDFFLKFNFYLNLKYNLVSKNKYLMDKKKILFVCLGNICRSPAAEGVMKSIIEKNNYKDQIEIDSAGTIDYHAGEQPDARMKTSAKKRGYILDSVARKFNPDVDFEYFDYIVAMDNENYYTLLELDLEGKYIDKIHKIIEFSSLKDVDEVPDPYYGGSSGFETVLNILEDACSGLFNKIKEDIESKNKK
jgi:protein-tyrosine phosphatase